MPEIFLLHYRQSLGYPASLEPLGKDSFYNLTELPVWTQKVPLFNYFGLKFCEILFGKLKIMFYENFEFAMTLS